MRRNLRIVSLLPAATEMVFDLGLERYLVGVSDDSDFPPDVRKLPKIVTSTLPAYLTSRQIDNHVRAAKHRGVGIFHINQNLLEKLKPNLILSQELCEVCAIGASEIRKAARILKNPVQTVSFEPETVKDVMENILLIGLLTGKQKEAKYLVHNLSKRLKFIIHNSKFIIPKPRVLVIEWLDPIMVAGHWVPEMVGMAGGKNLVSKKGEISKKISWQQVLNADPDILIIAPCGFDIVKTKREISLITKKEGYRDLKAVQNGNVHLIDGNAYLTRPGPRIVNGIEILAEIINSGVFKRKHPERDWQEVI